MLSEQSELIEQYVDKIRKLYGNSVQKVILYGSYARGDFNADSDVDIMILLDLPEMDVKSYSTVLSYMTYDFNMDHDIDIKPIAKCEQQFEKWERNYPFYSNVRREGIVLYERAA